MSFIRPIDWNDAPIQLPGGYTGQYLYRGESCLIIATRVPPGASGPAQHTHTSDQFYFVSAGEIGIQLGAEIHRVAKDSLVFMPAGLPHHNWNDGPDDEIHIEVIAPSILPTLPSLTYTDSTDALESSYRIVQLKGTEFGGAEFAMEWLLNRESGARHASLYVAEVPPGASGPPLHIHEFDQFYFILDGTLSIQIGVETYEVSPNHLVVLPARVPHRQWNAGSVRERHVVILAPEPELPNSDEAPWDVPVSLSVIGESA